MSRSISRVDNAHASSASRRAAAPVSSSHELLHDSPLISSLLFARDEPAEISLNAGSNGNHHHDTSSCHHRCHHSYYSFPHITRTSSALHVNAQQQQGRDAAMDVSVPLMTAEEMHQGGGTNEDAGNANDGSETSLVIASPQRSLSRFSALLRRGRGTGASSTHATRQTDGKQQQHRQHQVQQCKRHHKLLRKRYTTKVHAYAVPALSYFAPPTYSMAAQKLASATQAHREQYGTRGLVATAPGESVVRRRLSLTALTARDGDAWGEHRNGKGEQEDEGMEEERDCRSDLSMESIAPLRIRRQPPQRLAGRLIEQQRYRLPRCPPYRIPLYDQACFKYIFPNLFKNARRQKKLEVMQMLFLSQMFLLAIFNTIMTIVNVFFSEPGASVRPWARVLGQVIFALEFAIVILMVLFTVLLVLHAVIVNHYGRTRDQARYQRALLQQQSTPPSTGALEAPLLGHESEATKGTRGAVSGALAAPPPHVHRRKNGLVIGTTELAQDFAALITLIGTFSVLRIIGLASPSFAFRRILPVFQNAVTVRDVGKGVLFLLLWIVACLLAFLILIAKVTQIDFAFTESIADWNIVNYVQLAGLLFNLARVDDSYYKETSVLLDAVHQHYSPPGQVREYFPTVSTPLYGTEAVGHSLASLSAGNGNNSSSNNHTLDDIHRVLAGALSSEEVHYSGRRAHRKKKVAKGRHQKPKKGPPEVVEVVNSSSLLTTVMRALRIPPFMYFTYFDVIYDYHFNTYQREEADEREKSTRCKTVEKVNGEGHAKATSKADKKSNKKQTLPPTGTEEASEVPRPEKLPARTHIYNFFNYLSFIFEIDNVQLRRYLQMVHSPQPFYRIGRESFLSAFVEKDLVGMDMALWRSDPTFRDTQRYALAHPDYFNSAYTCEDMRSVWDPRYEDWAHQAETRNAAEMALSVAGGVVHAGRK